MAQEIFRRYEKKYILDTGQYYALLCELARHMSADEYGRHTVSNIYFDTRDFFLIRESIEKPVYKEKVRLRAYGSVEENSAVYAELKKKYDGVVYKRRLSLTVEEARRYLYCGVYPDRENQVLREIDFVMKRYDLKPAAYIAYDRNAFCGREDRELRVTFDRNVRCRNDSLDLRKGTHGTLILGKNQILMEAKIPGAMPLWMCGILSELRIFPVSFSKYGAYYKDYLADTHISEGGLSCA